jgi:hypothetical protein
LDNTNNQLPAGYTLGTSPLTADTPSPQAPANQLPEGYTLGSQPLQSDTSQSQSAFEADQWGEGTILGNVGVGFGKGLEATLTGTDNWARQHLPAFMTNSNLGTGKPADLQAEQANSTTQGTAQGVGAGLESIGEFLLGDSALKGLSLGDKLTQVSKVMKYIEKSPMLAKALGIGVDALRAGTVQAGQTIAKGGTAGEALTSGAGMAAGSGAVGAVLGAAGGLIGKGAEAADTVNNIRNAAKTAPTGFDVTNTLSDKLDEALYPDQLDAAKKQAAAEQTIAEAAKVPEQLAVNAPSNEAITTATQKAVKAAHTDLMNKYGQGLDALKKATEGQTIDYEGSPLHQAAQTLANKGEADTKPLDEAFNVNRPGSTKASNMVDLLANPEKLSVAKGEPGPTLYDASGNPIPQAQAEPEPITMGMQELVDRRKQLGELLRNTGFVTDEQRADRDIYQKLIQGTDDSIQQLVTQAGNPDAINTLNQMNANYKTGIQRFANTDVKALLQGNSNDVAKRLMGGGTSVADINAVRATIGKDAFQKLGDDAIQRFAADAVDKNTGQFSFDNFFKKWNNIPSGVRQAMFQDSVKAGKLQDAMSQVQKINASGVIPDAKQAVKAINGQIELLLDNGDISSLLKDPQRAMAINQAVGPEAAAELGQTIMQNKLREASTDVTGKIGNIDTAKFLSFVNSLSNSPEVVDSLFKPTKESEALYDKTISDVKNVHAAKILTKAGIIGAGAVGLGHAAAAFIGHALLATVGAAGAEGTAAAMSPKAGQFLEWLANHPVVWGTFKALNTAAKSGYGTTSNMLTKYAAGKAVGSLAGSWQKAATSSLSGQ